MFLIMRSTGKWFTSLEQPHDEIHLAIGGQDHQPIKSMTTVTYDKNGDVLTRSTKVSPQVSLGHEATCEWITPGTTDYLLQRSNVLFCFIFTTNLPNGRVSMFKIQSKRILSYHRLQNCRHRHGWLFRARRVQSEIDLTFAKSARRVAELEPDTTIAK